MTFTEDELSILNAFLNGAENLPVEIEALNVKLRTYFSQDTSVEAPEVEAIVAEESDEPEVSAEPAPEETVDETPAPSEETSDETPVDEQN